MGGFFVAFLPYAMVKISNYSKSDSNFLRAFSAGFANLKRRFKVTVIKEKYFFYKSISIKSLSSTSAFVRYVTSEVPIKF